MKELRPSRADIEAPLETRTHFPHGHVPKRARAAALFFGKEEG
jgi:hypothetical protein